MDSRQQIGWTSGVQWQKNIRLCACTACVARISLRFIIKFPYWYFLTWQGQERMDVLMTMAAVFTSAYPYRKGTASVAVQKAKEVSALPPFRLDLVM